MGDGGRCVVTAGDRQRRVGKGQTPPMPPPSSSSSFSGFWALVESMKLSLLHQYYNASGGRWSNSLRSAHQPPTGLESGIGAIEGIFRSPTTLFRLALHAVCYFISLPLGFQFSRLLFTYPSSDCPPQQFAANQTECRVVVGHHGIWVQLWSCLNPVEVMKAHQLIEVMQSHRLLIIVTSTHVRTFQTLCLTGLTAH